MKSEGLIRVMIVDDHAIVREGLRTILQHEPDIEVTAVASDAAAAMKAITGSDIDVALLDIALPGRNGLDLLRDLTACRPALRVVMFSIYSEERFAVRAIKAGAHGYLTKEVAPEMIVEAIRKVYLGGRYITPVTAEKLAAELADHNEKMPHERLSDREFDILCLIGSGLPLVEIAAKLSLSDRTVSTYRARIMKKMNLGSRAEIIQYVLDLGLI
jgi:DNA-binding NarL/FixJ family response regulator